MKEKHILPFDDNPVLSSYFHITYGYSLVAANLDEETYQFLITAKYINCVLTPSPKGPMFIIPVADIVFSNEGFTFYQNFVFCKDTYRGLNIDIVSLLKSYIRSGIYISGVLNCPQIFPDFEFVSDSIHNYLITGYDDQREIFVIKSFDEHSCIKTSEIPYSMFLDGLFGSPKRTIAFYLWSYNPTGNIRLNIPKLILRLNSYLSSSTTEEFVTHEQRYYGMLAVQKLLEHILLEAEQTQAVNELHLKSLLEQKLLMKKRLHYLNSRGIVGDQYLEFSEAVYDMILTAQKCACRFNQTHAAIELEKINQCVLDSLEMEKEYLPHLVHELSVFIAT